MLQVVVEHQGHQGERWASEPGEHPLPFVAVGVDTTGDLVAQRPHQRRPPVVGEVLGLVDHNGVEPLGIGKLTGSLGHPRRQPGLPILGVVARAVDVDAPAAGEILEGSDECRALRGRPDEQCPPQVVGQSVAVADHRNPLPSPAHPAAGKVGCLPHRQHRLAAARSPADLDAVEQPGDAQQVGLLHGQPVGVLGTVLSDRGEIAGRQVPPHQDLPDQLDVVRGRRTGVGAVQRGDVPEPSTQIGQLMLAGGHPARALRCGEVVSQRRPGQHDVVTPPDP